MTAEPQQAVVGYPGGLRVRYRWAGSGGGGAVFALSEAGGELFEYGERAGAAFERLCRAELRTERFSAAGARAKESNSPRKLRAVIARALTEQSRRLSESASRPEASGRAVA